jgi:acetylornithine deacetylase/succinyl-diaminopimelate desuccinylase-like protein
MRVREERPPTPSVLVRELAGSPAVSRTLAWVESQGDLFTDETARIAEIPAPTFAEGERGAYVARRFHELGLERVEIDGVGNVYGLLPGDGRPALAFLAHLDTVFPASVSHTVAFRDGRLYGPGVGDNAAGLAGTLGAVRAMRAGGLRPARPVWFVASVGEEGLGNLRGASAAVDRLGEQVDAMVAVEGSFYGRLSYTGVGSRRLQISCHAHGGHSWHDFGRPGAVHGLVGVAAAITALPVPAQPRTTFNIGRIEGGTGVNVIAEEAHLLLDLRSLDARALDRLTADVREVVAAHTTRGVEFDVRQVGFRPPGTLDAGHCLVQTCSAVLRWLGAAPQCAPASTDANIPLSRGIPAVTLGITHGGGAHTRAEWIETAPMVRGVQQIILATLALADPRTCLLSPGALA